MEQTENYFIELNKTLKKILHQRSEKRDFHK